MVAKRYLEPILEEHFHPDSYGYRPRKSAIEAIGVARQRCWRYGWVLDLDIKGFFDNIDHGLLMRAVRKHTDCRWVLLYIDLWLMLIIAVIGYLLRKLDFSPAPLILGMVLGQNLELAFRRSLIISSGNPVIFFTRPISAILLVLAALWLIFLALGLKKRPVEEAWVNPGSKKALDS